MVGKILSIVTIHYDDFLGLERTFQSLFNKKVFRSGVDWIVVDGGTDLITEKCANMIPYCSTFISEPDFGVYDAMNKGVNLCESKFVLFLNAGDELHSEFDFDDTLDKLRQSSIDLLYGASEEGDKSEFNVKAARSMRTLWWGMPTHHQAMFFSVDKVKRYLFDDSLSIASDYKLCCEFYRAEASVEIIDTVVCRFYMDGVSSKNYIKGLYEQWSVRRDVLGISSILCLFIHFLKLGARFFRFFVPFLYHSIRYAR